MKKLILPLLLLLSSTGLAQSLGRYNNWCEEGGQIVVLQGLNSVTNVQQSAPMCTVEVFLSGTNTHASLFADNSGSPTPLSNPFTASTTGQFGFYATPGVFYDVVTSNGIPTLPSTVTYPYVIVSTPGTGTGTVTGFSSGNLSPLFTTSVATASSTPALTFTLSNANAHKWFGNNTGSTAAPGYETIGTADLPFTYSGNTTELMTVGTVSGTGSTLCTDASGNATTVGCSGGGGITGSGTTNRITKWTGTSAIGNTTGITDNSNSIQFGSAYSQGLSFAGVSGQFTASTAGDGFSITAANAASGGTNTGGAIQLTSGADSSFSGSATILMDGAENSNFGGDIQIVGGNVGSTEVGGEVIVAAGSNTTTTSDTNKVEIFGNPVIIGSCFECISPTHQPTPGVLWIQDTTFSNVFEGVKLTIPSTVSTYTFTLPANTGSAGQVLSTNGSGVTSWTSVDPLTTTNCAASGTGANPSVVACGAAKAGAVYCDVAASTGTCQINTSAVTANSEIFVIPNTTEGSRLGKTCNTAPSAPPAILLVSKSAGNNFIINMSTVTTNGECYDYLIVN